MKSKHFNLNQKYFFLLAEENYKENNLGESSSPEELATHMLKTYPDFCREKGLEFQEYLQHIKSQRKKSTTSFGLDPHQLYHSTIMSCFDKMDMKLSKEILIREFPTNNINGTTVKASSGYLVLLNQGLMISVGLLSHLISDSLERDKNRNIVGINDKHSQLITFLIFSYSQQYKSKYIDVITDLRQSSDVPNDVLSDRISITPSIECFVLLHEYSHIALKHMESNSELHMNTNFDINHQNDWDIEYEADLCAIEAYLTGETEINGEHFIIGVITFLFYTDLYIKAYLALKKIDVKYYELSHPPAILRAKNIIEHLNKLTSRNMMIDFPVISMLYKFFSKIEKVFFSKKNIRGHYGIMIGAGSSRTEPYAFKDGLSTDNLVMMGDALYSLQKSNFKNMKGWTLSFKLNKAN